MTRHFSHQRAVVYSLLAYTLWVLADCCAKLAGQAHVPYVQMLWLLSLFGTATLGLAALGRGRLRSLRPRHIKWEILRALLLIASGLTNLVAFTNLPLSTVYVVIFLAPMLISLCASKFMHEPLSRRQGLAIFVGFCGVVIAINPANIKFQGGEFLGYLCLPLLLILYVAAMLAVRYLGRTETSESMSFFPLALRSLLLAPLCLMDFSPMTASLWATVAGLGILGATGAFFINTAYKNAPAAIVAPFHYTQIVTGALLGYLIFGDVPSWNLMVGATIIIASGFYLARQAHRPVPLTEPI